MEFLEHLDDLSVSIVDDQILMEKQMVIIAEMSLVFLYKSYEIMLNEIIKSAYGDDAKELFKWKEQDKFLKGKNIQVTKIDGYKELNQLRIIVNNIKHGTTLDAAARSVQEFINSERVKGASGSWASPTF